jgi:hypothetical protein
MAIDFKVTGTKKNDLWLINDSPVFAIFPANTIPTIEVDIPIWLKVGNMVFGEKHIRKNHGHWVNKQKKTVPELVHFKLGQSGSVYCTESDSKLKVNLSLSPSALLILELINSHTEQHFSVTSLYFHSGGLDGISLGRYRGRRG